ncbi:MAG: iron-sulfur cluster assembly scaffold protein [Gemmatimonadetes bacterium]|nr:iron-sulfur cluster assembly scaffold protein [Gemmatimonadota bacterium]
MSGDRRVTSPYGPVILEHFRRPQNRGDLENADAVGEADNPLCGDRVRIAVRLAADGRIEAARFRGEACAICTAAASLITGMVHAITPQEAASIGESQILGALGAPIRPARMKCATLPIDALHAALDSLTAQQRGRYVEEARPSGGVE